jgi:citrate/tricarballylate utilization protein
MWPADLLRQGQHVMTVCNACRYCEGYCPVFPAMEHRIAFAKGDLTYLANLCHNCGECLYACQYAPPHEFGINVPRTLAQIRLASYEEACWPRFAARAFRHQPLFAGLSLVAGSVVLLSAARAFAEPSPATFYQVLPHHLMVTLFSIVGLLVVAALAAATLRQEPDGTPGLAAAGLMQGMRDAATLRYMRGAGENCTDAEDTRRPWRRWFHHCTFYGFALCFASTTVAAIYHLVFGWVAPYALTSVPVVLGTVGGLGLLVGPSGLLAMRQHRDPELGDPAQSGLDLSFIAMLLLTSASGLLLLALRDGAAMPSLLIIHLAFVLALFLMLPFGKFVHGLHRLAALARFVTERAAQDQSPALPGSACATRPNVETPGAG